MLRYSATAKAVIVALSITLGAGIVHYYRTSHRSTCAASSLIQPMDYARDAQDITTLFKADYNWLSTREFDPTHIDWTLRTQSPNEYEPEYEGKMHIDVLRDNGHVAGFVTYYLRSPFVGTVLFLEVGKDFRSKGYGETLIRHAINELFAKGVQVVQLLTRVTNLPAQRLYNRVGFVETSRDEGFVYFAITPQQVTPVKVKESKPANDLATSCAQS